MTDLIKALAELPAAYHALHLFITPGTRPFEGRWAVSHHSRIPVILAVLDLLDERLKDAEPTRDDYEIDRLAGARRNGILPTLSRWVRLVDGELWDLGHVHVPPQGTPCKGFVIVGGSLDGTTSCTGEDRDHPPTVDLECAFLTSHAAWILESRHAQQMTDEVGRMLRDCQIIVGTEEPPKLTCTKIGCGWAVHEQDGGAWYKCSGCGNAWGRLELHKMAERKQPKPLAECAELAGVHKRTLQRYKDAGKLRVKARRGTTELFDLDEVMQMTMDLRYRQPATA